MNTPLSQNGRGQSEDPLPLAQALIRCASVTPADAGAQEVLAAALERLGFTVIRLRFGKIENLFARIGSGRPHLCFAGHTDVVPPGGAAWRGDPFAAEVRDGVLYGRGACDMKGAIAAFVAGAAQHLAAGLPRGSISLLITGDEEGPAIDGTAKVLEWIEANGQIPDFCLVGEPTCPAQLGEMVKIGRRGSLNATITVHGTQGHVAYPHRADNPVHRLVRVLAALTAAPIDAGSAWFQPTSLQVTSVDVGNPATNVIPAAARAMLNIRFNDRHSGASLTDWLRATIGLHAERFDLDVSVSGESFLTEPGPDVDRLREAIVRATGLEPKMDTGGGTSDARFIARYCPVAEFGLVGATMHQADECVPVAELRELARIYRSVIAVFLA
ncbi:MAG: succinyl-diaminopimelate desuccinylase [Acetobacteraceae bacterium]|nr:succinyl-diaminopimelate desuccinylase [Acetobacteraceae bacterium]